MKSHRISITGSLVLYLGIGIILHILALTPVNAQAAKTAICPWARPGGGSGLICEDPTVANGRDAISSLTTADIGVCQVLQDDRNYVKPTYELHFRTKGPQGQTCDYWTWCDPNLGCGQELYEPSSCKSDNMGYSAWNFRECQVCKGAGAYWLNPARGVSVSSIDAYNWRPFLINNGSDTQVDMPNSSLDFRFELLEDTNGNKSIDSNDNVISSIDLYAPNYTHLGGNIPITCVNGNGSNDSYWTRNPLNHYVRCSYSSNTSSIILPVPGGAYKPNVLYGMRVWVKPHYGTSAAWIQYPVCTSTYIATITPTPQPSLSCFSKTATDLNTNVIPNGGSVSRGQSFNYIITAANGSSTPVSGVYVLDLLPKFIEFVKQGDVFCDVAAVNNAGQQEVRCEIGSIGGNGKKSIYFVVRVRTDAPAGSVQQDTATVYPVSQNSVACIHKVTVQVTTTPPTKTPTPPTKTKTPTPPTKSLTPTTPVTSCLNYGIREKSGSHSDYGEIRLSSTSSFTLKRHFSCSGPGICNIEAMDNIGNDVYIIASNYGSSVRPVLYKVTNKSTGSLDSGLRLNTNKALWGMSFKPGDNSLWVVNDYGIYVVDKSSGNLTTKKTFSPVRQIDTISWNPSGTKLYAAGGKNLYEFDSSMNQTWAGNGVLPAKTDSSDMTSDGYLIAYGEGYGFYFFDVGSKIVIGPRYNLTSNFDAFTWLCGKSPITTGSRILSNPTPATCTASACSGTWCGSSCESAIEGISGGQCVNNVCYCKPCGSTSSGPTPTSSSKSPTPAPFGTNLLLNPGFEDDKNTNGRPDYWTDIAKFTRSTTYKHGGTYSGRIYATDNSSFYIQQTVNGLTAGKSYNYSGWINIRSTSDSFSVAPQIIWKNSSGGTIRTDTIKTYTGATGGWVSFTGTKAAPSNTNYALVRVTVTSLNANIYIDDFSYKSI